MSEKPAGRTILASGIAKGFIEEVENGVKALGRSPKLVGFLANEDPAAQMYADWTGKTSESLGFTYELRVVKKDDLEEAIIEANEDDAIDGIMVYFPVFGNRQDQYLQQVVSLEKDVEGLNHKYIQNMYHNVRFLDAEESQKSILPCTPLAVVKILEYLGAYNNLLPYGNRLYGKQVVVVNRSEIVGRPLAALLANDGATVFSVDLDGIQRFTRGEGLKLKRHQVVDVDSTLEEVSKNADVIVTGVPSANYKFPKEFVKDGAIVVNFSSEKNFNPDVKERASLYVPMIGKVTIAMLLRNLLRLASNRSSKK
ncbi:Methylenetetrahydrofolate dehydrogenase [NAD+] [Wickerhamomyces ciferrii]|uniref:Methylenetetrahydrofolate dehydrogenase [NAD(+)] n=1 Tax=Wickerhamomyces ciferrii (strain ATCC 14091 / BCRC 22168 / CBS 111 / JCM 3599 / NBRC 0793 / NRRL Y-1031 F-60-10) TaxID=1206466 RepID=K0KLD5_WICCF|nr:Methylenetetrahydrofolate dehydrogenase [NAD+] [Wickerhamomyces ciferrii]CCH43022.1 Methylenetetrahydrofolate dehydrogenase [NAD+] [Wickerhamomyces ciferrii]